MSTESESGLFDEDRQLRLLEQGRRVAVDLNILGGWDEHEVPTPEQLERAELVGGLLWHAADLMLEDLFGDAAELQAAAYDPGKWLAIVADSQVLALLPARFHHHITPGTANRVVVAAIDLFSRLTQGWRPCSCTAQEILLWMWLGVATGIADTYEIDFDEWRDDVAEELFEDLDFEMLYDDSLDGFEDDPDFGPGRLENLRFDQWFIPFGDRRLPPFIEDQPT